MKRIKLLANAYRHRKTWPYLTVHKRSLTKLPASLVVPLLCGHRKGALRCPPNLTIVLVHNYAAEPIMETSLRYVGIERYVVLKP